MRGEKEAGRVDPALEIRDSLTYLELLVCSIFSSILDLDRVSDSFHFLFMPGISSPSVLLGLCGSQQMLPPPPFKRGPGLCGSKSIAPLRFN